MLILQDYYIIFSSHSPLHPHLSLAIKNSLIMLWPFVSWPALLGWYFSVLSSNYLHALRMNISYQFLVTSLSFSPKRKTNWHAALEASV